MRAIILPLLGLAVLGGCTEVARYTVAAQGASAAAVRNVQQVDDLAAQVASSMLCKTPWGEVARNGSGNPGFPEAVFSLCGIPAGLMRAR